MDTRAFGNTTNPRSSGDTADAKAIPSSHGLKVMAFSLRLAVKSAKPALDFRAAACEIAYEWFAVTVTAADAMLQQGLV